VYAWNGYQDGYGVDIYAPEVPYVTTTLLVKRPLTKAWKYVSPMLGVNETVGATFGSSPREYGHTWTPPDRAFGQDEFI
jgi:hypothetical protein